MRLSEFGVSQYPQTHSQFFNKTDASVAHMRLGIASNLFLDQISRFYREMTSKHLIIYNVFTHTRNTVDLSMHGSNKEHTDT